MLIPSRIAHYRADPALLESLGCVTPLMVKHMIPYRPDEMLQSAAANGNPSGIICLNMTTRRP